ncbi:MAG: NAD(P)-dependent oxidoreductase [Candidatus Latescibacterota bacterium]|nr:NAD(P)-dependent oxidoreductase [Candidatus Latescibacterota bacterium]
MEILITGITGRIGANLAKQLVARQHQIRGLVWPRDPRVENLQQMGVELVEGSLTEPADVARAVEGVEAVYHLGAAFQGGGPFTDEEFFETNVRGTFNMLEAVRKLDGLGQFLFASSDALYDKYIPGGMPEPIDEQTPRVPRGAYALSKSLGEELCNGSWQGYKVPTTILRFAMVRAADEILEFPQFYLSKMKEAHPELAALWQGEERAVLLKDERGRPFKKHIADVRDIVHGCLCALGKDRALGETFQLAGPHPFTWDEVSYRLAEILKIPHVEAQVGGTPTFYEFDLSKAERDIGFSPSCDIVKMIVDALNYQRGEDIGVLAHG